MSTTEASKLREVLDEITPKLDHALEEGPLNDPIYMGEYHNLSQDMKRRGGICNATSWLLSSLLRRQSIYASPHYQLGSIYHRQKRFTNYHVMLKTDIRDGRYIDPTYQQYYRYVGLTAKLAEENSELETLYPENDIAIIQSDDTEFQESFAINAHRIEHELAERGIVGGILSGTSLDEKIDVYKQVWGVNTYKPHRQTGNGIVKAVVDASRFVDRYELIN